MENADNPGEGKVSRRLDLNVASMQMSGGKNLETKYT